MSSRQRCPHARLNHLTQQENGTGGRLKARARWRAIALVLLIAALPSFGQVFDNTGNAMLEGRYFFRYVNWTAANAFGDIGSSVIVDGVITFNGTGGYSIVGEGVTSAGAVGPFNANGTYRISSSGFGFLQGPLNQNERVIGSVSDGVFTGSATESRSDFFVAAKDSGATRESFQGPYKIALINLRPQRQIDSAYTTLAELNPNGQGNIGTVPSTSYLAENGDQADTISHTGVTYAFNDGYGLINFPTTGTPLSGNYFLFLSPDGNFIFGGNRVGFDFFIGVKTSTNEPPTQDGAYISSGIYLDASDLDNGAFVETSFGALTNTGGLTLLHERYRSIRGNGAANYTGNTFYPTEPTAEYFDDLIQIRWILSPGGKYRIGTAPGPYLGIFLDIRATLPSGSGVFLNPVGVINSASFAPFTSGVAHGELLDLYGSGLSPESLTAPVGPLPPSLAGVRVLMNNRPAPILRVSEGVISAVVPFGITEDIVQIQVDNNGQRSNAVTAFRYGSAPGVYAVPPGGEGLAAVLHQDGSLVTDDNPAQRGEALSIYLNGLGDVFPTIVDGDLGPRSPLSQVDLSDVQVFIGRASAQVIFAGLAPTLPALYQINAVVGASAEDGRALLEVCGLGACNAQLEIPVAGGTPVQSFVESFRSADSDPQPAKAHGRARLSK